MAFKNQVTNEIKNGGGGAGKLKKIAKKAPTSGNNTSTKSRNTMSSGMGYTRTSTNRATGKKTTTTGTLTPTSAKAFKSNAPRTVSTSTPTTRTSPKAKTNRKIY